MWRVQALDSWFVVFHNIVLRLKVEHIIQGYTGAVGFCMSVYGVSVILEESTPQFVVENTRNTCQGSMLKGRCGAPSDSF